MHHEMDTYKQPPIERAVVILVSGLIIDFMIYNKNLEKNLKGAIFIRIAQDRSGSLRIAQDRYGSEQLCLEER